ncbi:MAG: GMC family oxidoreductase [Gammaproteobacteria bacterium]|nr:GMC family oxidoreductase [Gammaproteobacteria bacterium]
MSKDKYLETDVCIVGSGAGAGPVALELSQAGHKVLVLEKGPWFTENDFYKDELACCRRSVYTPDLKHERHVIEDYDGKDANGNYKWKSVSTEKSGSDFWNGNCVGGSSNFMSGFFYRLKPADFRLKSEFGAIKHANVADWPLSYDELEPYYAKAEQLVGISGRVTPHPNQEPRSTKDFPYPPTQEHAISQKIDRACDELSYHSLQTPRAILSQPAMNRRSCEYSGFCGSYGCSSGAKGSARAALLDHAIKTGNCNIKPHSKVFKLDSDDRGNISSASYYDKDNQVIKVKAKIFVVACHAIETSRLLLSSTGPKHLGGLANNHNQVGKNLLFSAGGSGTGEFEYEKLNKQEAEQMKQRGPFVNRGLQDWYFINDKKLGGKFKGGTIDFLLRHPNAISRANNLKWGNDGKLVWGQALKAKLYSAFTSTQDLRFEVFNDWLPTDDCFVSLDKSVKDKWGSPVAKVRVGYHDHDLKIGKYLAEKAERVLKHMGATNIRSHVSGSPPPNLVAGGCRFGNDIKSSVLNKDCRAHDVENLYITDGSFMPTGGSVPYTWTIYANSFRVADIILSRL